MNKRIVDENIELSAGNAGDLLMAGLDAVGLGDVEGKGGHAHVGHFGEDLSPARGSNDMDACCLAKIMLPRRSACALTHASPICHPSTATSRPGPLTRTLMSESGSRGGEKWR